MWLSKARSRDVLVMTPAVLQQLLTRALLGAAELGVLVMDEAHHAAADHPYAVILRVSLWLRPFALPTNVLCAHRAEADRCLRARHSRRRRRRRSPACPSRTQTSQIQTEIRIS